MRGKIQVIFILISIVAVLSSPSFGQKDPDQARAFQLLSYYLDLLQSGNTESAAGLWEPSAAARSTRLGIEYQGIPVKIDCNSPVIFDYERSHAALNPGIQSVAVLDSGFIRYKLAARVGNETADYFYHMKKTGNDFWLIPPHEYYAAGWPINESKYFRLRISPKMTGSTNTIAIKALDDFVDKTALRIGLTPERLALLAEKKIDYYLCQNEFEVGKFSGRQQGKGYYEMGTDAVITSIFPHFHEVAHLLINFRLQNLPPFTAPFLQEGLAVNLGGRWQRSSAVMNEFGRYMLNFDIVEIDSILLESDDGSNPGADVSYPAGACLAGYLHSTLGNDRFLELYRALSGNFAFIKGLTIPRVKEIAAATTGQDWATIIGGFKNQLTSPQGTDGKIYPGDIPTDRILLKDGGFTISASAQWLKVEYQPGSEEKIDASLVFNRSGELKGKESSMFVEQYRKDVLYDGWRYGIRLDKNEIGLYDYATNQLLAKYVYDFNPSPRYHDTASGKFTAHFAIALLENALPSGTDYAILK